MAERLLAKEEVASSTLVFRSRITEARQLGGLFVSPHDCGVDLAELRRMRLSAQRLATPAGNAAATVRWMGALQAQDYQGGLWAIGIRSDGMSRRDVEAAIERREVVRTWPMRGTLHFISPELVRPVLRLTAPRVAQRTAARERQLGLDDAVLHEAARVLTAEIQRHGPRTRPEMYAAMESAGLSPAGQRGIHILGHLARDRLLCFGPHRAKQATFVLLDDWLPHDLDVPDGDAARELARRYFVSHGPATVHDFAWWSNLTVAEARAAVAGCQEHLHAEEIAGRHYWFDPAAVTERSDGVHLLPPFDELVLGYTDRSTVAEAAALRRVVPGSNGMFLACVAGEAGEILGLWRKVSARGATVVDAEPFGPPLSTRRIEHAADRYLRFIGER